MTDREDREKFAHEKTCEDLKRHYEQTGNTKITGEQIEKEVQEIAREVERKKEHPLYK